MKYIQAFQRVNLTRATDRARAEPFLTLELGGGANAPPFLNFAPQSQCFWPHKIIPFLKQLSM